TRFRALIGGTRKGVERAIEAGFPLLPPGCAIRLDEIAQEIVLNNVRSAIRSTRRALIDDLRGMPATTSLAQFLRESYFELTDVYSSRGTTFSPGGRSAGPLRALPTRADEDMGKPLAAILHVDDE